MSCLAMGLGSNNGTTYMFYLFKQVLNPIIKMLVSQLRLLLVSLQCLAGRVVSLQGNFTCVYVKHFRELLQCFMDIAGNLNMLMPSCCDSTHKTSASSTHTKPQHEKRDGYASPMLAAGEGTVKFSLKEWSMVGSPPFSDWPCTQGYMGRTNQTRVVVK